MADIPAVPMEALRQGQRWASLHRLRPACTALARAAEDPGLRLEALLGWADALHQLGNVEEAAERVVQAIGHAPAHRPAWDGLMALIAELDHPEAVVARAARVAEAAGSGEALAALARFEAQRGQPSRAQALYERARGLGTLTAQDHADWALASLAAGDRAAGLAQLRQAWAHPGAEGIPRDTSSAVLQRLIEAGPPEAAERADIEQAAAGSGQVAILLAWAGALWGLGRVDEAAAHFQAVLAQDPGQVDAATGLAWCRLAQGDPDAAAQAVDFGDRAVVDMVQDPRGGEPLLDALEHRAAAGTEGQQLAWAERLEELGHPARALNVLADLRSGKPSAVPAALWAHRLHVAGRSDEAMDACMQAMQVLGDVDFDLVGAASEVLTGADPALRTRGAAMAESLAGLPALRTWALALDWAGDAAGALAACDRALAVEPGQPDLLRQSARLLCVLGQAPAGLTRLAESIEAGALWPPIAFTRARAELATAVARLTGEAGQRLRQALSGLEPGSAADAASWGEWLLEASWPEAAVELLERTRPRWPDAPEPSAVLAAALARAGRHAAAADACVALIEQGYLPQADWTESRWHFWSTYRSAAAHLGGDESMVAMEAAVLGLDSAFALRQWALALGALDRPGAELRHYEAAAARRPGDATLRAEWAYRLQLAGQTDRAAAEHARAERKAPADDFIAYLRGRALTVAQRFDEALAQYARQARLKGHPPEYEAEYAFDLGVALDGAGRREEAVRHYQRGIGPSGRGMTAPYCLHNIAYIRQSQGDYRAAEGAWRAALAAYRETPTGEGDEVEPDFFNYHAIALQFTGGEPAAARELHEQTLRQNPRNTMALLGIVRLLVRQAEESGGTPEGRTLAARMQAQARETAACARSLIDRRLKDLDLASTRLEAGQLALLRADTVAAVEHLQAAVRLEPERIEPWLALVQARWRHGDAATALQDCQRAVAIDPESLDGRCTLGEAYRRKDDAERAEIEFRRVLSMAPGHIDARLGLGRTLAGRAEVARRDARPAEAEQLCAQALEQFAQADRLEGAPDGSRALSATERHNLNYLRGYLKVMRFELQPESRREAALLESAMDDFGRVPPHAANHHRALRARQKIIDRTRPVFAASSWGPWVVVGMAVFTLVMANLAFLVGRPALLPTAALQPGVVAALGAASVPAPALERVQVLVAQGPLPRDELQKKLVAALGEPTVKAQAALLELQTANGQRRGWGEGIDAGYYALLNFGALLFVVAGLYLRQLSKLKIGGIELEKASEPGQSQARSLDIGAPDWQMSTAAQFASTGSN